METNECILTRRSIRKFYDIPVPLEYITDIINAGIHAPSAGNLQSYKFVVVTDDETRLKISDACLSQAWITTAPVIIVICSEVEKLERLYGMRGKKMYSLQECACVAENMLLRAHELDLGACFVSAFDNDMLREVIDAPKEVVPQVVIPLGYADEKVPKTAKYEVRDLTYFDTWDQKDVTRPWPLVKFKKPIQKKAKSITDHIKEKVYNALDKINKAQKKAMNKEDIDKNIASEQKFYSDYQDNKKR